jgi:hypothetical protein
MQEDTFRNSPFQHLLPYSWQLNENEPPVYSVTRSHGLKPKVHYHHLADPFNADREGDQRALITYELHGRHYDLFKLGDLRSAPYAFDELGISNLRGDLAERVARRMMKRFLQRYEGGRGRLGGLFSKEFDPKRREGFLVANNNEYVLKIGSYPNMILLKKNGNGKWGYQHITDLDGLFDYRYSKTKRIMLILESKVGKIDVSAYDLYERVFEPLQSLFPEVTFTYALFADRSHLFDKRYPEYRMLTDAPTRIFEALRERGVPSLFFDFVEDHHVFDTMCRHLVTTYRTLKNQSVTFNGTTTLSEDAITIFGPGAKEPYMVLEKDRSGHYRIVRGPLQTTSSTLEKSTT